mmetsp:Transcript_76834/g.89268  ORF Transcript_76834/g.89268 Transcript_76834/m.89268 type:complete len:254 (-) Transcript_76834:54-815(-)
MPLLEPYKSPMVHHVAMRPDPASLPVAGFVTNAQPVPASLVSRVALADSTRSQQQLSSTSRSLDATAATISNLGRTKPIGSPDTCTVLMDMKAFHRQKNLTDAGAHFTSFSGRGPHMATSTCTTCHESYKPLHVSKRKCRYSFDGPGIPRGSLSGIGVSVPSLDLVKEWESTSRLAIRPPSLDQPLLPRTQLVEKTRLAVMQSRERPEAWKSSTLSSFSTPPTEMLATLRESIAQRQEHLERRSDRKPLRPLA